MVLLIIDEQTKGWKEISVEEKKELSDEEKDKVLYIDSELRKRLDFAVEQQHKDNDVVGIVCGDEGSGKSSHAGNIMRYISKDKFNPKTEMIGSDYDDGLKKIGASEFKGRLMFDEGNVFFLSTEVMKKESRELHKIFSIFRQQNLFVLIVLPSFFRLGNYFALDRCKFVCRTYLSRGNRGYFAYYGEKLKNKLYRLGKKDYNPNVVRPTFRGRFQKCLLLENKEYKDFKLETLKSSIEKATKKKENQTTKSEENIKEN